MYITNQNIFTYKFLKNNMIIFHYSKVINRFIKYVYATL